MLTSLILSVAMALAPIQLGVPHPEKKTPYKESCVLERGVGWFYISPRGTVSFSTTSCTAAWINNKSEDPPTTKLVRSRI